MNPRYLEHPRYNGGTKTLVLVYFRAIGKAFYETIFWSAMLLNNGLAIMPTRNLVNNMGVTADSTHFTATKVDACQRTSNLAVLVAE